MQKRCRWETVRERNLKMDEQKRTSERRVGGRKGKNSKSTGPSEAGRMRDEMLHCRHYAS